VAPVTVRQLFTGKTPVEGNARNFYMWFFSLAVPANLLNYLLVVLTNSHVYQSTSGIWLEAAIEFTLFVTCLIVANRKSARLIHPDDSMSN